MATVADLIAALTLSEIFLEILPKSDFPGLISRISTLAEDNCESVEFESPPLTLKLVRQVSWCAVSLMAKTS